MNYPLTLTHVLRRIKERPRTLGLISKSTSGKIQSFTCEESYQRICRLARALQCLGVKQGDRVGTLAWNTHEHYELYFALPCTGLVLHTLNLRFSVDQLAYVIQHAQDRIIFVDASLIPLMEKVAPLLSCVEKYVLIGAPSSIQTSLSPIDHYEDLLEQEQEQEEFDWPGLDENQAAGLCYTSGTTGNPKGALYTHRSQFLHAMSLGLAETLGIQSSDKVLPAVPMFHANAWGLPYCTALVGAQLILPGPFLKPHDVAQLIQDFRVTLATGVPTIWMGFYQELKSKKYDISSIRSLVVGGSAMPRSLIQGLEEEFHAPVIHLWGMTELSPLGTCTGSIDSRPELNAEERYHLKARQGFAAPHIEMRIVNDNGEIQPRDGKSSGELQVRGPCVISSYYEDPHGDSRFAEEGWFKTGDIAVIAEDGNMTLVDRAKDLIKSGGEWISSVVLENALMCQKNIREAVVIGIPDEKWGERPLALVVPVDEATFSPSELRLALAETLVKFWIPERIQMISEIPKTSVGKFDKKKLREQFAHGQI